MVTRTQKRRSGNRLPAQERQRLLRTGLLGRTDGRIHPQRPEQTPALRSPG